MGSALEPVLVTEECLLSHIETDSHFLQSTNCTKPCHILICLLFAPHQERYMKLWFELTIAVSPYS